MTTATVHGRPWTSLMLPLLAAASGGGALLLQRPILTSEPVFALVNSAVPAAMVTLGSYMAIQQRERFTGLAFVVAGLSWPLIALDIYPGWGSWVAFVFGGGATFFPPICWGVLRYGRPRLTHRTERLFIPFCAVLTSGTGIVFSFFARPEWVGLSPAASWPALWPDETAFTIAALILTSGFVVLALCFLLLIRRLLREAPPTRRDAIRPLCIFGVALGIGASIVFTVTTFDANLLSFHALVIVVGALALSLTGGLGVAMARQEMLGARLVARLPESRTPESVTTYLRAVLQDESAELLFVDPDDNGLIDADGRRRLDLPDPDRFHEWINDGSGSPIGLLVGHAQLRDDTTALGQLRRVVAILADNARLQAVLRMQVAQLTASRTAQQLAFAQAREEFHRDLHDGVQQTIAAARMDLDGLADASRPDERADAAAQLESKLRLALDQVHALKRGVQPPELRHGLKPAIDRTVAELRLNARCRVTDEDLGLLMLPVYYLVRESLTNVHKHAGTDRVEIEVQMDGRTVAVAVSDNGVGGASPNPRGGIDGMRRRVEELGGHWEISSPAGQGTTMKASVPCVSS